MIQFLLFNRWAGICRNSHLLYWKSAFCGSRYFFFDLIPNLILVFSSYLIWKFKYKKQEKKHESNKYLNFNKETNRIFVTSNRRFSQFVSAFSILMEEGKIVIGLLVEIYIFVISIFPTSKTFDLELGCTALTMANETKICISAVTIPFFRNLFVCVLQKSYFF